MKTKPLLVATAFFFFFASSYGVMYVLFPRTTADILAALDSDAGIVIWLALILVAMAGVFFIRSNKETVQKFVSGDAHAEDAMRMWFGDKNASKSTAKRHSKN